jgi:hypothetical protein
MQQMAESRVHPELKELVAEASRALARLDADRLEELALSCQALNRDCSPTNSTSRAELAAKAREAAGELAVFAKVLDATRANLGVMNRLREFSGVRLEYGVEPLQGWALRETAHGDN